MIITPCRFHYAIIAAAPAMPLLMPCLRHGAIRHAIYAYASAVDAADYAMPRHAMRCACARVYARHAMPRECRAAVSRYVDDVNHAII